MRLFGEIQKQTGYSFVLNPKHAEQIGLVSIKTENSTVTKVLNEILGKKQFVYSFSNDIFIVTPKTVTTPLGDEIKITGSVMDSQKNPLPGVTVRIKGISLGTATDVKGIFTLHIPKMNKITLIFSFIGMDSQEIDYTGQSSINVILKESSAQLEEVIVSTGYQTIDKRRLTSAITTLKADDIMVPGMTTIDQMLEGHVPGMTFMQNSGQVGAAPKLRIRGTSTILGNQEPLWVVDGVIVTDPVDVDPQEINDLDFVNLLGNAISGLNPDDIDQIDVLKDAAATAVYGPKAANGVIVITTRKGKVGKPSFTYSFTGGFRQRPRYSDKAVYVMNSMERVDFSRELYNSGTVYKSLESLVGYESAIQDYLKQKISYNEFQKLVGYYEKSNTDWFDILLKDAFAHSHTFNVSGGTENLRYYASVGYNDEQGNIRKEINKRYSVNVNLTLNYNNFSMNFGLNANTQKREYTPSEVGLMNYAYNTSRAVPAYNEDGSIWFYRRASSGSGPLDFNILNERDNSFNKINTNAYSFNTHLDYRLSTAFKIGATLQYNVSSTGQETYYGEKTFYTAKLRRDNTNGEPDSYSVLPFGGELKKDDQKNESYTIRTEINYNQYLDHDNRHQLTASVIGELSSSKYSGFRQTLRGYFPDRGMLISPVDKKKYEYFANWLLTDPEALGVLKSQLNNKVAAIATIMYSYNDVYMLNANIRIDASNKFGDKSNDRLLPIWSVSGRWNTKQDILQNIGWINDLSLRASFGYQGNMLEGETPELIIKKGANDLLFNEMTSSIHKFPNPNLRWEKTASFNTTLDFVLLKNKIRGSISYYYRKTTDAFLQKTVSPINGVDQYSVNKGTLTNTGYELSLNFTPIDRFTNISAGGGKGGFSWRIDPQFGSIVNQLVNKLKKKNHTLHDEIKFEDYLKGNIEVTGRPLNSFFSYKFKGLNPEDGRPMFYNIDEKENKERFKDMTKEDIFLSVMEFSGTRTPFLQGGLSNTFQYNNLVLSFNLTYSIGSKVRLLTMYPDVASDYATIAPTPEKNVRKEFNHRWRKPGDEKITNIPGVISADEFRKTLSPWWFQNQEIPEFADNIWQMYDNSDLRVASGDYLKLQSLSLRYIIPQSLCNKLFLKSAYVSLSGSNLFTICAKALRGQDPSQSGSSSSINLSVRPMYNLRVNLTF